MELELGLKITRTREDVSSSVDFCFSKDTFGPLVLSRETDSRFIIIIHLKGFKKEGIEIKINKEGNRITIRGRKSVEEMVLIRWMTWRKEVELRTFRKVFLIPDIVDLDKIKARFEEDDSTLTITMPKRVKGISGFKIEEEEEERVEFGDVSEVENIDEIENGEEFEEENVERKKFETEIKRDEEFGEIMEDEERESQVLGEEEGTEDDNLQKIQQIDDEQDKILGFVEEETIGRQELSDSNKESENSSLRKLPTDILGREDSHEEQVNNQEQKDTQAETKSDDFGSREFEEIEKQGPGEQLDRTSESGAIEKKKTDDDGLSKVQGIEERERRNEESKIQEMVAGEIGDEGKEKKEKEFDAKMSEGFAPNIAETETKAEEFESDKLKEDEVDKIQFQGHEKQEKIKELVEEKTPMAETNIANDNPKPVQEIYEEGHKNQAEEYKEKIMERGKKINDAGARKVQEIIRQQELNEQARCENESKVRELVKSKTNDENKEEKEIAETETKEQESYRPELVGEQDKIQELAEKKTNFSKNGKVKEEEEEEVAEKKTEFGDDNSSRKVGVSDAIEGQEVKDKIQELVMEENVSDGGKGIIAVAETIAENDHKSRKVQEIDEQQSHEEDTCGKQFQKLKGGEISGRGEVEDVENEKKTTEADKRIKDSTREAQEIEKKDSAVSEEIGKEDTIQEVHENKATYRNEHEEEKNEEADKPEKITGTTKQELVNLNSQSEQDNVEDGGKTRELVEEKTKDCKQEESMTKTDDDIIRKVQDIKEHELYEPKRDHISKIKELVEEQELHESNVHKERDKTRITGAEEPSGQEKEEEEENLVECITKTENDNNSLDVQEIKEERPDKPESHEKQYKIQEVVEAIHNDHKEEEQEEKVIAKEVLKTEEDSSKKVQEIKKQEYDDLKRSMVQDKMEETEENCETRAVEGNEIVERRTKTKDGSLRKVRDDEDPRLSKPYKTQEEYKIQELVEMGTSDYREKVKNQDGNDILRRREAGTQDLDELERHSEQSNIPQLVEEEKMENIAAPGGKLEDDNSDKFHEFEERNSYEDWTHEKRENRFKEATDPKDTHTGREGHNDHKEEHVIAKAEMKTEEDNSKKAQEIEKQEYDELQRSMVQDKMKETEEKDKTRAMEENEIVERRTKTKDVSLRNPELGRHKRHGEEDRIQELVETDISDHIEKVKKKDVDDILKSQESGKLDLGELERHCKQRKIQQSVQDEKGEGKMKNISELGGKMEGDSAGRFHEFQKQKSYEDWRQEESEEIENLVKEEANDPKDKHTGGKGEHEEERYEKVAETKTKVEDEINKKVGKYKEPEFDKQERFGKLEKLEGVLREGESDREKEEENLMDDFTTTIQEEESHEADKHKKPDIVQDLVEDETGNQEEEKPEEAAAVIANNEKDSSRKLQKIKEQELKEPEEHKEQNNIHGTNDPGVKEEDEERVADKERKEQEAHVQELEGKTENFKDDHGEGRRGDKRKQRKIVETKSDHCIVRNIRETKEQESKKKKDQELEDKIEELERKETSNHEVKLLREDDRHRKGQEFLEKESKRQPVEEEKIQELKEMETRDRVNENEEKAEVETKIKDGKSRKFKLHEMQGLDEPEENEEQKKIQKPVEEKKNAPEKEGNEKIAEEEMQDKIDSRIKGHEIKRQEPYELLKNGENDKIPEPIVERTKNHREEEKEMEESEIEEMKRIAENVSSRKIQQIKDELEKHHKPSEIPEKHNIQESVEQKIQELGYKALHQDVEEKGSNQEQEKIEEQFLEEEGKKQYDNDKGEQKEKTKRIPQVELKANDDSSRKSEIEEQESTRLRGQMKREKHQELVERETSDHSKEEKEDLRKAKTEAEYDRSRKIQDNREEKSEAKLGETSNRQEGKERNRVGTVWGEGETKTRDDVSRKVKEIEEQESAVTHKEQEKKQTSVKKDTVDQAKEKKDQETNNTDDISRNSKEYERQESDEQKRNEEQDKNLLGLTGENKNDFNNQEGKKVDKEIAEANGSRKLKEIEERESTEVGKHENPDNIQEFREEKMVNQQEGEDNESINKEVETKSEDHESKRPVGLKEQDEIREPVQQKTDNLKDEETAKTETKSKDSESSNMKEIKEQETSEQMRLKEQERVKKMVEDRTSNIVEDGSSEKIQEIEKEESIKPGRDEKRDKIQEPVDMETSEHDEEEVEVECEESEEEWEAEVIQEINSDEDNDKIRHIRRIKLGFRFVGGSALFMSLIVIVISFIRSKKKIRCHKF